MAKTTFTITEIIQCMYRSYEFYRMVKESGLMALEKNLANDREKRAIFELDRIYRENGNVRIENVIISDEKAEEHLAYYQTSAYYLGVTEYLDLLESKHSRLEAIEAFQDWVGQTIDSYQEEVIRGECEKLLQAVSDGNYDEVDVCNSRIKDLRQRSVKMDSGASMDDMLMGIDDPDDLTCVKKRYKSGISRFDEKINFLPGNWWMIIAPPGYGKTLLCNQVLCNLGKKYPNKSSIYFNMEMNNRETMAGFLNYTRSACHGDLPRARDEIRSMNLTYYFAMRNVNEIVDKIRMKKEVDPTLSFVAIDYVQCLKDPMVKSDMFEQMTSVTEKITTVCKELGLFMIVLSQPDKGSFQGKNITMYSGKGSGEMTQSASYITTINGVNMNDDKEITRWGSYAQDGYVPVVMDFGKARFSKKDKFYLLMKGNESRFYETNEDNTIYKGTVFDDA